MEKAFAAFAKKSARYAGTSYAFLVCVMGVVVWAITGPLFGFSDTWQLVLNTITNIITFLMVFLIQNSQNRDAAALQVKLDELIRSSTAPDHFIGIEKLSDEELELLHSRTELAAVAATSNLERANRERVSRGQKHDAMASSI